MKNLKLFSEVPLSLQLHSDAETLRFSAFDIERNRLFFLSSHNLIYASHLSSFHEKDAWSKTLLSTDAVCTVDLEPGETVTSFDYLMEKEALILGTSNGLLLLYSVEDNATEVVGRVEGGVKCISPSPDGELIGIITGFGQILVMTHDWDLLYETPLDDDLPEGFDVSEERFLADRVEQHPLSWRGDGKYFATMSDVHGSDLSLKKLKVWERDSGASLASAEAKAFAGTVLEWMPSGAKIAAVYDRKAENECPSIVFFERNGLERSKFSINEGINAKVKALKWNCSSDLLASLVECENYDAIKIWYYSNNHWYLKHEVRYLKQDEVSFIWNPARPLQFICWTLGGEVTAYNFAWITAVTENSIALVVDGSNIHVTPLSLSLMPPPMYLFSLKFSSHVRGMAVYCKNSKNQLAVFLSDGCLCIVELPSIETWEELEGKEFSVEASHAEMGFGSILHLVWLDPRKLLAVSHYGFRHSNDLFQTSLAEGGLRGFYLQEMELECSEDCVPGLLTCSGWHATVSKRNSLEDPVIGIAPNPAGKCSAFLQFSGGKIQEYVSKIGFSRGSLEQEYQGFSSACPWMSVALVGSVGPSKPVLFGLDEIGRLHANGGIVCNNCSSFSFYSNLADQVITHLILATKQDLLFIVDIVDILNGELDTKYGNFVHINSRKREESEKYINIWERGAKIVGVLHGDEAAVILQTTRGNLECTYPRKLVLVSIINALVQKRFKDALLMVRRHRIDFNVIVDYCGWQAFSQSASEFVRQVNNLGYITEFVCSVKNENIIEKLYKNYVSVPCPEVANVVLVGDLEHCPGGNKVSYVLMAVRKALEDHLTESPARELCILTTLARSDPPLLEEALKRVKVIREMELSHADDQRRISYPSAEEALKHLLWLADSDAVYESALGLYDLNLAAIVALNAQKDPKEFLPFLQELQGMPTLLMQYNIDLRLQRFEKALRHIASAGDSYYDDCMTLVKKNPQLFPLALQLFTDPSKRMPFLEAWGDYLSDEKCFEDAATIYLSCFSLDKALKSYRAINNWSGVLTVAGLLNLGKDEILHLASELCEELQALGKPGEAAKIALEYCGDVSNGVNLLISARDWEEALRVAFMHRRDDLIKAVNNASAECASTLIGEYEEGLEKVGKYLARYLAVRQRRLLLVAKLRSEELAASDIDDDAVSETSSNFSGMSAYTTGTRRSSAASISSTATSKARENRRQRKRGKIRPGSPDEEMALVEHLKGMSLTVEARRELNSLLVSLMMFGEGETAKKLQQMGENFQLSQIAAVKLAEDTMSNDTINEHAHTLEHYTRKVRTEMHDSEALSWRIKVFLSYE